MLNKIIMNKKLCIALALIAVVAAGLVVYCITASSSNSTSGTVVEVSALDTTRHGVKTDTGFLLTCSEHMNEQSDQQSAGL